MRATLTILASAVVFLSGCANTSYRAFESRNAVFEGTGGTRDIVDGMDIWQSGDPPRRYRVLGVIDDDRPNGLIQMGAFQMDMVKKAREVGGDAIIRISKGSRVTAYQTEGTMHTSFSGHTAVSHGTATTTPIVRNTSSFAVIKYLD